MHPAELRCIGLMSGTSLDGVDGALVDFAADGRLRATLALASAPLPDALRATLARLQAPGPDELATAARAGNALADRYADCVEKLLAASGLAAAEVAAIGAHGQTVRHDPAAGYTLQLLNAARLAERTGIAVVADLRSADVAAGGQGAPLVPAFHARVFAPAPGRRRGIVNIGGIANLSVLATGAGGAVDVTGFDTGPGNTLLDTWCERRLGPRFDDGGRWAAGGRVDGALLGRLRAEAYFARPAPKSTGRDLFNLDWLDRVGRPGGIAARDVQATLLALTAGTIADAVGAARLDEVYVCGGGAANGALMQALAAALGPSVALDSTQALGMPPQAVEATAFAWLARQRLCREAGNLPSVTGARRPCVLGALYLSRP